MKRLDLSNKKFNRLLVLRRDKVKGVGDSRVGMWVCLCDCGKLTSTRTSYLKNNHTQSCGCLQTERVRQASITHNRTNTAEYRIWRGIINRCFNKNEVSYPNYGGRGIGIYPEWRHSFQNFLKYVGNRPDKNLSLDRINNNGNYEPGNVRWATAREQCGNTRKNKWIEYNGVRMIRADWCRKFKISNNNFVNMSEKYSEKYAMEYYHKKISQL